LRSKVPVPKPPTSSAKQFLQYILWFGVGLVVGLAPFLGAGLKIPGFSAVLDMYPFTLQSWLLPLSGILMGAIAAYVEFLSLEPPAKHTLQRRFGWSLRVWAATFVVLIVAYTTTVSHLSNGDHPVAVATGTLTVPPRPPGSHCGCTVGEAAEVCVNNLSLKPELFRDCFGSQRVVFTELGLAALYLLLTGSFVLAIGFLMLRQRVADAAVERIPTKPRRRA
jgi:hypothetical protein